MSSPLLSLIAALARKQPELEHVLNPPASKADTTFLEKTVGMPLPPDFVMALKTGNGQKEELTGIFKGHRFLCIEDILSDWKVWKMLSEDGEFDDTRSRPDSSIKKMWWNPRWVPFTNNGSGDHFCLDMDPSSEGMAGQVIFVWHDSPERRLVSSSFSAWVSELCTLAGERK